MIKYELMESYLLDLYKELIPSDIYEMLVEAGSIVDNALFAIGAYDEETSRPVGAVVFDQGFDDVLDMVSIAVTPEFRRQKIASTLVKTAFAVVLQDESTKNSFTFTCTYRMEEERMSEFDSFMEAMGVVDYFNLPNGATFKLSELMENERFHDAIYGLYEVPEYTYRLNDLAMEMNVVIRDNTTTDADGTYSFIATDEDAGLYCSIVEKLDDNYFKLYLYATGEDEKALFRAFEATVSEFAAREDFKNTIIDVSLNDEFTDNFFKSLGVKEYQKILASQAIMIVENA